MSPVAANREIDGLIRDGIPLVFDDAKGRTRHERIRVIDFNDAGQNRYLAVSQLWIKGEQPVSAARYHPLYQRNSAGIHRT